MFCREDGRRGFCVSTAIKFGVDEAILIQHMVHELNAAYMLRSNKMGGDFEFVIIGNQPWLPWTLAGLQSELPFWSLSQVRRVVASCIEQGVIKTDCYNDNPFNRRLWYTVEGVTIDAWSQR